MPDSTEASSAATNADANKSSESSNLDAGAAAARLFANAGKPAAKSQPPATEQVAQEPKAPAPAPEETQNNTVAETEESVPAETQTEEPEAADKDTADPDAENSEDEVLSNRTTLDEKTKQRIQKRIDKEVGKRKALEGRLSELENLLREKEAQVQQPPVQVIQPSNLPPNIAALNDLAGIEKSRKEAKEAMRWAKKQLDADADGEPLPEGWNRKLLKQVIEDTELALEDHLPQREQFLRTQQQISQAAAKEFPFLTDRSAPEYQMAQAAKRANPWLQGLPNADWIVGVQILGLKALEERKAAANKPKPEPAKPKVTPKPSSDQIAVSASGSTPRVAQATVAKQNLEAERAKFDAKGGITANEAAAFLLQKENIRNSR